MDGFESKETFFLDQLSAFTVADIAAMVAVDFAAWVKATPPETAMSLRAWYERVSARPSATA